MAVRQLSAALNSRARGQGQSIPSVRKHCAPRLGSEPPRRAFSLVELMIVIAVIVIIIALLLPAVSMVRARSRQTKCANNLKNVWTGWTKATQQAAGQALDPTQWSTKILPYLGNESALLACPDKTSTSGASYGMSNRAHRLTGDRGDIGRVVILDFDTPEANVVVTDFSACDAAWVAGGGAAPDAKSARHFKQQNVLMNGGQVEPKSPESIDPRYCDYFKKYWRPSHDKIELDNCLALGASPPSSGTGSGTASTTSTTASGSGGTAGTTTTGTGSTTGGSTTGVSTTSGTTTGTTAGTTTGTTTATTSGTTTGTTTGGTTTGSPPVDPPPDCGNPSSPIVQGLKAQYATYYYTIGGPVGEWGKGAFFKDMYINGSYENHLTHFANGIVPVRGDQFGERPSLWGFAQPADWGGHEFIRYCGQIKGPITGTVYFQAQWDDMIEMVIDNQVVIFDTVTSNWDNGFDGLPHIIQGNVPPGSFVHDACNCPNQSPAPSTSLLYTTPYFKFDFVQGRWYDFRLTTCNSNAGSYYNRVRWYTLDGQIGPGGPVAIPAANFRTNQN